MLNISTILIFWLLFSNKNIVFLKRVKITENNNQESDTLISYHEVLGY